MQFTINIDDDQIGDVTSEVDLQEAAHKIAEAVTGVYDSCGVHIHRVLPMKPCREPEGYSEFTNINEEEEGL